MAKNKRVQIPNPFDPKKKVSISGTDEEVRVRAQRVRDAVRDWRLGLLPERDLRRIFERTTTGPLTVRQAWEENAQRYRDKWARQAQSVWRHLLEPWFGDALVSGLDAARMRQWLEAVLELRPKPAGRPYARATILNAVNVLRTALRRQVEEGRLDELPWGKWRPEIKGRPPRQREACRTVEEATRLVAAAHRVDRLRVARGARFGDLAFRVLIGWLCCLRQGELAGLGWDDLPNLDGEVRELGDRVLLHVRHQAKDGWRRQRPEWARPLFPTKWRDEADEPDPPLDVHPSAAQALRAHRDQLRSLGFWRTDGPVFPTQAGRWRGHADAIHPERELRPIVRDAGLPGESSAWVPHSLRTTGASLEARVSGDLKSTMLRTRHRDPKVLLGYMRDVGRGVPRTALPEVEVPAYAQAAVYLVAAPHERPVVEAGAVSVLELREEDLRAIQAREDRERKDRRNEQRARYMGRDVTNLAACYDQWVARGREGLPPRLQESLKRAYDRGYNAKLRGLRPVDAGDDWAPSAEQRAECGASGRRARLGTLSIWERYKKAADKKA